MKRDKFEVLTSTAVVLPINNIDTDQIIPARFLKTTQRGSFADNLFRDQRFDADGDPIESFALNYQSGSILVAGNNFGCGSSREHAAWALYDYGFRAVVSSSFADIFKGNALNNALLPVCVSEDYLARLTEALNTDPTLRITISLLDCTISSDGVGVESFAINGYKRECLMKAFDDIDYLIANIADIEKYESQLC